MTASVHEPAFPWGKPPAEVLATISPALTAFYIELYRVEEDGWRERLRRDGLDEGHMVIGDTVWFHRPDLLAEISERHGVRPGDDRVYSIWAYKDEMRAMDYAIRPFLGRPEWGIIGRDGFRYASWKSGCRARHFPGVFTPFGPNEYGVDSAPKLWAWIDSCVLMKRSLLELQGRQDETPAVSTTTTSNGPMK